MEEAERKEAAKDDETAPSDDDQRTTETTSEGSAEAAWKASRDEDVDLTEIAAPEADGPSDVDAPSPASASKDAVTAPAQAGQVEELDQEAEEQAALAASEAAPGLSLEQRIAELEAAIEQSPGEWEPDGSEAATSDETTPIGSVVPPTDELVLELTDSDRAPADRIKDEAEPADAAHSAEPATELQATAADDLKGPQEADAEAATSGVELDAGSQERAAPAAESEQEAVVAPPETEATDQPGETASEAVTALEPGQAQDGEQTEPQPTDVGGGNVAGELQPEPASGPAASDPELVAIDPALPEAQEMPEAEVVSAAAAGEHTKLEASDAAPDHETEDEPSAEPALTAETESAETAAPMEPQTEEAMPAPVPQDQTGGLTDDSTAIDAEQSVADDGPAVDLSEDALEPERPSEPQAESSTLQEPEATQPVETDQAAEAEPESSADEPATAEVLFHHAPDPAPQPAHSPESDAPSEHDLEAQTEAVGDSHPVSDDTGAQNVEDAVIVAVPAKEIDVEPADESAQPVEPSEGAAAASQEGAGPRRSTDDDPEHAENDEEPAMDFYGEDALIDEDALREMVSNLVREELQGVLGERITRNVRRLVRREIQRAMALRDLD
ncbi:MAG: hypothetical protein QNJ16_11790 [Rhodobacter sp.]|nr:hypothetical protein [Rhodobacter sp.]